MIIGRRHVGGLFVVCLAMLSGCSKEKFNELVDKTKQKVTEGTQQVQQSVQSATGTAKEQLSLAGKVELNLDAPLTTSGCYALFLQPGDGRPQVLQLRSYRDAEHESFPSLLLQAQVTAANVQELVGQVVSAQLYVQREGNAPVLHTPAGSHVELKLTSADENSLIGEIMGGALQDDKGSEQKVSGNFTAIWFK